jgi:hypothetical protein
MSETILPGINPPPERVTKEGNIIHYALWKEISADLLRGGEVAVQVIFEQDCRRKGITRQDIKNHILVFDLKPEGISSDDFYNFYKYLVFKLKVPSSNIRVVFSAVEDVTVLPYPAVSLPDRLIYNGNWYMHLEHYHIDWESIPMTHKLVCLMRRASVGRGNLAKRLLAKINVNDMIMTFGTNGVDASDEVKKLVYPQPFPMIVDRPMADEVFQHRIDHEKFYQAPLNLVVESSSQLDPNTWTSIFITEKTFKALAWHQFPVWYAVPGLVNEVRKIGFDVFDDIFDGHAYDQTQDPWTRMTQVVQLVSNICKQDNLALFRKQHWNRLLHNAQLIKHIYDTALDKHKQAVNGLIHGKF